MIDSLVASMARTEALTMGSLTSHSESSGLFRKWSHVKAMMESSPRRFWVGSEAKTIFSLGTWKRQLVMTPVPMASSEASNMLSGEQRQR